MNRPRPGCASPCHRPERLRHICLDEASTPHLARVRLSLHHHADGDGKARGKCPDDLVQRHGDHVQAVVAVRRGAGRGGEGR